MTSIDFSQGETPRQDAPGRDSASEGISQSGLREPNAVSRDDAATDDKARQDAALRQSSYTLTVEQIMQRLDVEGVSKSKRTVQRYFQRGEIDAKIVTTSEGQRWLANELDAARFIEDLKRREALALMTRPEGITFEKFDRHNTSATHAPITPAPRDSAPDESRRDADAARLEERVSQMSERLADANSQITHLREQVKDANEHVRLWSDRAKELKDLLQAQAEANTPVLAALAKSIEAQARGMSRPDAARHDADVVSIG